MGILTNSGSYLKASNLNLSIKLLVGDDEAKAHLKYLLKSPCFVIALKTPHPPCEWPINQFFLHLFYYKKYYYLIYLNLKYNLKF